MLRPILHPHQTTSLTPTSSNEPTYIFALSLLPSTVCALTSASTLHLLSSHTLQPTRTLATPHTLLATYSPTSLLTSGHSNTLTLHDLRAPTPIVSTLTAPAPVTSLAVSPSGLIAAGTELTSSAATVQIFDPRQPTPLRTYTESHNDDVTALCFSSNSQLLASGGTDGLVNIFSLSAPAGTGGEADDEVDGALRSVINHGSSVHRCGWMGQGEVWALSHDEVLSVYGDCGEGEAHMLGDVRESTGAEYVVDVLPRGEGGWVVAGNKEGVWVDFVPLEGTGEKWGLGNGGYRLLEGRMGGEVCRDVVVDIETNTIFTGGEDGLVKTWRPPTTTEESAEVEKKVRKKEKKEKKDGEKKKRYKPY